MDQEINPSRQGRIDSVKINPSLLRMRECKMLVIGRGGSPDTPDTSLYWVVGGMLMMSTGEVEFLSFCVLRLSDSQIPFFGTKPHVHGTVQNFRDIMMIMTAIDDDDIQGS